MALAITNVQQETVFANRDGLDLTVTAQLSVQTTAQVTDHVSVTAPAHVILAGKVQRTVPAKLPSKAVFMALDPSSALQENVSVNLDGKATSATVQLSVRTTAPVTALASAMALVTAITAGREPMTVHVSSFIDG